MLCIVLFFCVYDFYVTLCYLVYIQCVMKKLLKTILYNSMYISQCEWVSFYESHDFLVINKLVVCSVSILPPSSFFRYGKKYLVSSLAVSVRPSVRRAARPSVRPSCRPASLSVCPSVRPSVRLSVCSVARGNNFGQRLHYIYHCLRNRIAVHVDG